MLRALFWPQMLRLKAKAFKILIDDSYLQAEMVNVCRGPTCTGWHGLHLQESFTAAPKAFLWLQVHKILVLNAEKRGRTAVKGKKIWKRWKSYWDWIINCFSLDLFVRGEGLGWGSTGGMWGQGHAVPNWAWVVLHRDVERELSDDKPCEPQGTGPSRESVIRKSKDRSGRRCPQLETLQAQQRALGVHPSSSTDG